MLVVTTQQQSSAVAGSVGTAAVDGTVVTQADLDKAVQKELLLLLPALVTALNDPAVQAATTPAAKEAALAAAAAAVLANSGLTSASVPTVVAINNQVAAPPVATPTTVASFNLRSLTFSDAKNYVYQVFTSSAAQNTPDANSNVRYVDRHVKASAGNVAKWGMGGSPIYGSILHWNGSAWTNCPINFENVSSLRDAQGTSAYNYCDGAEVGKNDRATFDVSGRTMASVYAQIRGAGYTSLTINDPSVLGTDVFPAGSSMYFMTSTALSTAISYYPAGANNPVGSSNLVTQYSAAVSAGGDASSQGAGVACNSAESSTSGANSTTLESLVATMTGTPCRFKPNTFVYGGVAYSSGDTNEWWGNSTVSVGKIGTAPIGSGTAPGYYTTNTLLRAAFRGSGTNAVTYYACQERFNTGSARNCTAIGTGTYAITTYGDGRALTFNNLPAQTAALTYDTVLVERAGLIYFGSQNKPGAFKKVRLNTVASTTLMTKLGLPIEDPNVPLALTAGSYQGTWDFSGSTNASGLPEGISIFVNDTGTLSCEDQSTGKFYTCTLAVTDPGTGAFTLSGGTNTLSGNFDFLTGTARGNFQDAKSAPPTTGTFVGGRR